MENYIDFELLKRVAAALIAEGQLSDRRLKQIDPRLSSPVVQRAFAQNAGSPSVQALQQFAVSVLKRGADAETRAALARCLSFFTERQTIQAYQHLFGLFLEEM